MGLLNEPIRPREIVVVDARTAGRRFREAFDAPAADPRAPLRHWCYPSAVIGCGLPHDGIRWSSVATLRSEVTCPGCLARIRADGATCEACRMGAPERIRADRAPPHTCDPGEGASPAPAEPGRGDD